LPRIIGSLEPDDVLLISADHGNDPTTPSTDHSREHVPLLLFPSPPACPTAVYTGTLADTGATVYGLLTGKQPPLGGDVITACRPSRGWRPHTAALPCPGRPGVLVVGRVGATEVAEAAAYLHEQLGEAPEAAVILGSGLSAALYAAPLASVVVEKVRTCVRYPLGTRKVTGIHIGCLLLAGAVGRRCCSRKGRL
jgi:hypothetical protein